MLLRRLRYAVLSLSACALLAAGGNAQAVDGKNRYLILGPGANTCSDIIANLAEGVKRKNQAAVIIYSNWLAGNLTSYNRDTKNTYSIMGDMSFNKAFEWTLNYCQQHPGQIYSAAVDAFIAEYRDDRFTSMRAPDPKSSADSKSNGNDDDDDDGK